MSILNFYIQELLIEWREHLKGMSEKCPSSCRGEIDQLKICIEDLQNCLYADEDSS